MLRNKIEFWTNLTNRMCYFFYPFFLSPELLVGDLVPMGTVLVTPVRRHQAERKTGVPSLHPAPLWWRWWPTPRSPCPPGRCRPASPGRPSGWGWPGSGTRGCGRRTAPNCRGKHKDLWRERRAGACFSPFAYNWLLLFLTFLFLFLITLLCLISLRFVFEDSVLFVFFNAFNMFELLIRYSIELPCVWNVWCVNKAALPCS